MGQLNNLGNKSLEQKGIRCMGPKFAMDGDYHELEMYGHLALHLHRLLGGITVGCPFCDLFCSCDGAITDTEKTVPLLAVQCFKNIFIAV